MKFFDNPEIYAQIQKPTKQEVIRVCDTVPYELYKKIINKNSS